MPYSEAFSKVRANGIPKQTIIFYRTSFASSLGFLSSSHFSIMSFASTTHSKECPCPSAPPYRSLRLPSNHKDGPLATPASRNLARPPNSRIPCFVRPQLVALFPSCLLGQSDLTSSWICPWDRFCVRVFEPGELSESLGANEGTNEGKWEVEEKFGLSRRKRRRSCKLSVEIPNACRSRTGSGESRLSAKTVRDFT